MTLTELAVVLGITGTVSGMALPLLTGVDDARVAGAARYLASRLVEARMDAIQQSREVAIRFAPADGTYSFTAYVDGNRNGVLSRDIQRGIDRPLRGPDKLSDNFRNVVFGVQPQLPPIDPGGGAPGGDPIKLGTSNFVSFSPLGTSSSGTVYITGPSRAQFAVRVFGGSGKIRVYRFVKGSGKWLPY